MNDNLYLDPAEPFDALEDPDTYPVAHVAAYYLNLFDTYPNPTTYTPTQGVAQ